MSFASDIYNEEFTAEWLIILVLCVYFLQVSEHWKW